MASVGGACGAWLMDDSNPNTFNITYLPVSSCRCSDVCKLLFKSCACAFVPTMCAW